MMPKTKTSSNRLPEEVARRGIRRAFTLIELLVVIGIIVVLVTMMLPAIKSLTKSNDQSQAVNVVRSMLASARSIAISQHRQAGVVFFEESQTYSSPYNGGQTAMQLFVEDFNQLQYSGIPSGGTVFVLYSPARQYLPAGIKLGTLADAGNVETGDGASSLTDGTRAIVFDANGNLVVRTGLCVPPLGSGAKGTYPFAYGDWNFFAPPATVGSYPSSPGFFIYSKAEYDAFNGDKVIWIKQHADVVIVNANTGGVFQ